MCASVAIVFGAFLWSAGAGDQAGGLSPDALQKEVQRLRAENAKLKKQVEWLKARKSVQGEIALVIESIETVEEGDQDSGVVEFFGVKAKGTAKRRTVYQIKGEHPGTKAFVRLFFVPRSGAKPKIQKEQTVIADVHFREVDFSGNAPSLTAYCLRLRYATP